MVDKKCLRYKLSVLLRTCPVFIVSRVVAIVSLLISSAQALAGFSVSGTQLLDGNGQPFIIRGINHPHTWYLGETASFANISATGANTVRVVLSDGQRWNRNSAADVANVIALCKQHQLICMLEVHDVTGSGEDNAAGTLANAAQYWVSIASALQGQEDYVLINIANEPFGSFQPASAWIDQHRAAIQTLRNAGLTHTLVVDAANWGQDWEWIMMRNASQVAAADNLQNTLFSVHMYQIYFNRYVIENYVKSFVAKHNLPLIIGEFAADHQGWEVDEASIMEVAEQYGIGYLGWSWSGNGGCCTSLDIVNGFNPNSLTSWGQRLINGADGIAATSVRASVYLGAGAGAGDGDEDENSGGASCQHIIGNAWEGGYQGAVRITNNTAATITGWSIDWSYTDGSYLTNTWNANVSGDNPYSASNLSGNASIAPGQSVEFGFIGNGAGSASAVTGDICD